QLAKSAIYAGIQILKNNLVVGDADINRLFIAGTFGNYIDRKNAQKIGLIPDMPLEKVVFVGNADSGIGRHQYTKLLLEELHDRKILFVGSGWEKYGYPFQTIAWGELLNIIYNLSNICLNISNDEQKNADSIPRMDANNRLFDLAMAGCFQISNAPQLVRHYFDDLEVVAIDSPKEWVSAIRYYLDNPEETHSFRVAAHKRALADHDWKNRAKNLIAEIELQLSRRGKILAKIPSWQKALRLRDGFV
ncbi:MAG: glycosyltransferase, partial [Proteobacteria bacterium]|nr:glycosyltransferase [Pseudomonadota bacterium]